MTTLQSAEQLRALYVLQRARGVSLADGPGFLYAFVKYGHHWKIGMTDNYNRRKAEWDHQISSPHSIRVEVLPKTSHLVHTICHIKKFIFFGKRRRVWRRKIRQCLCALHFCKALKSPAWFKYQNMNTEDLMGRFRSLVQDLTQSNSLLLLYIL
ncbi:hypothetical protein EV359DRAFT_69057 [Lentinula novae-zelandiae]|nr:hypothetical protein EV359DRAFT_69057 [Lentinula novae-zelandiae]